MKISANVFGGKTVVCTYTCTHGNNSYTYELRGAATFADRGCHVVSVTDPYDRILEFLDRR
jgi:hypothetical protein